MKAILVNGQIQTLRIPGYSFMCVNGLHITIINPYPIPYTIKSVPPF